MEQTLRRGMSPRRRDLFFKVLDATPTNLPILHFLNHFARCEDMLVWLIQHRATGVALGQMVTVQFGNSLLNFSKFLLMQLEHRKEPQAVIIGRDYISK